MSLLVKEGLTAEIEQARGNLSRWVVELAQETAEELGVRWRGARIAPQTLDGVVAEFRAAMLTDLPVRVSNRFCEQTIYLSPADNVAFRFVHDSRHYFLRAGFETEPELLVASCHLARLRRAGYPPGSIEHRLLEADTIGQALFVARTGRFVSNQLRFALRCLSRSIDKAIAEEAAAEGLGPP
ncbi:MAG: hypothetical protein M0Z95_13060 [Actinomycetota bacterium]|nr:hypothetical protein [Actinomycetota bacterium]